MAARKSHARAIGPDVRPAGRRSLSAIPGELRALQLERVIHEKVRLAIVSALAVNDRMSFNDLRNLLGASDGNLSVHARKLEDAGYIQSFKFFEGRMPKTEFKLTAAGRSALERYIAHMEGLIKRIRD
jgi:DNA-binding transcriptional ArsR family regulator